ncbi:hypothetical protein ACQPZQ_16210 [Pseudonocardia sp. CA-142604]|uniref:hypothetical protein n=1 Tax=Pseudonocardia sp. CA-142604 TaxID=3240024 RepID=UPI003D8AA07E
MYGGPPFACKRGVCACRARVTEGEGTMRRHFAIEEDAAATGFVIHGGRARVKTT